MPDEFKVVIAGLFELARDKNAPSPPSASAAVEPSSEEAVALEGEEAGLKGDVTDRASDCGIETRLPPKGSRLKVRRPKQGWAKTTAVAKATIQLRLKERKG